MDNRLVQRTLQKMSRIIWLFFVAHVKSYHFFVRRVLYAGGVWDNRTTVFINCIDLFNHMIFVHEEQFIEWEMVDVEHIQDGIT
jgi:hypothetical protein